MGFSEVVASRGLSACSRVLSLSATHNEHEIAARLALPATSRLLKLERLRQGGDEPFSLETCYLSAEEFGGLTCALLERGSLFSIMEHDYSLQIAYADEEIDATTADPKTVKLLCVPRGAPLLRIRQVMYSTKGRPTLYALGLYRSDRHTLLIRRFR